MNIYHVLAVAAGGSLGALARYITGLALLRLGAPSTAIATLSINVVGSLIMGMLTALFFVRGAGEVVRVFWLVGFLGAFTTFSTYSLDIYSMWQEKSVQVMVTYIFLSTTLSVAGLILGVWIGKSVS